MLAIVYRVLRKNDNVECGQTRNHQVHLGKAWKELKEIGDVACVILKSDIRMKYEGETSEKLVRA